MKKILNIACFAIALVVLPATSANAEVPGIANFHQVDQNVYRGAQPTDEGLKNLASLGVRTIIDLRHGKDHSDAEEKAAEALGLRYINVPMEGLEAPTDRQISSLMELLNSADRGPVFVHCREGKDRTGTVVACYRIAHDHWTNDHALDEAREFGLHPLQRLRRNFILNFTPLNPAPHLL